jgi:RNA polymerase sigma-70 factor, ECF subfamily
MRREAITPCTAPCPAPMEPCTRTFDALYERHFDFIFRCLRRLGVAAGHAEDATQDVFIVLHRRLSDLRPDASERGFLFAIARRVGSEYRRKQARMGTLCANEDMPVRADLGSPFEAAANAQAAHLLDRFLRTLDEDQRSVFMLIELEDMSAPEVAQALCVKLNTVYSRLRLARERFMRFISEQGIRP